MGARNYELLWQKLDAILSEALEIERVRLGVQDYDLIKEFIDHNEFGLAHEQLFHILSNLGSMPKDRSRTLLDEARQLMQAARA